MAIYHTILGRNPRNCFPYQESAVTSLILPRLGEHDMKLVVAESLGQEYYHYGYRVHPKAQPINVHVYGERKLVEHLAENGYWAKCELELVVKKTETEREFILVNLFLAKPWLRETHSFCLVPAPQDRPWFVYATRDMRGVGISVKPL